MHDWARSDNPAVGVPFGRLREASQPRNGHDPPAFHPLDSPA